ncbi:hypothetical protein [Nocardia jiangxiensis]|uniref:hypothetical protein n=1 Tax=Nocardia jiangxiensis TaxID=282685 RepID=UPI0003122819|nr:hypothetical protein [Nocardia jiangxiensis]
MSDMQELAEEIFESLRRHVLMARLSPAGGAFFAIMKLRQSYSTSRNRPLFFNLTFSAENQALVTEPTLSTVQIDRQTEMFGPSGEYSRWFNRAWIPSFFAEWEGDYRHRLAPLLGKSSGEDVRIGYFGDLRLLRNDIIHHKAKTDEAARAKCVVLKWFEQGEEIALNPSHYADLFGLFPWEKLGAVVPDPPAPKPVDTRLPTTPFEALMQLRRNPGHFFG